MNTLCDRLLGVANSSAKLTNTFTVISMVDHYQSSLGKNLYILCIQELLYVFSTTRVIKYVESSQ